MPWNILQSRNKNIAKRNCNKAPLIVFVHVPKAAGSTVAKFLYSCSPLGLRSVETLTENAKYVFNHAEVDDWISGHLPRVSFSDILEGLNRPIEYYSTIRLPSNQLISSLNYSFERFKRGNYFSIHSREEQLLDMEVISTDFSNKFAIMALLLRRAEYYLNCQSRLILGPDFEIIDSVEIIQRINSYYFIANEFSLGKLYDSFGFAEKPKLSDELMENVASYHFDRDIFNDIDLQSFLNIHLAHDYNLYKLIGSTFEGFKLRNSFREAQLGTDYFDWENYSDEDYLMSCPDVADAVSCGLYASAREHFEAIGHAEGRMRRVKSASKSTRWQNIVENAQ